MRKSLGLVLAAGLAATAASVTALPAAASPVPDATAPMTGLVLTKTLRPVNGDPETVTQVTLQCEPAGGTHPTPQAACDSLIAVDCRFGLLPQAPGRLCLPIGDPVTVQAHGYWRGQRTIYFKIYPNDCQAEVMTDNVFRF